MGARCECHEESSGFSLYGRIGDTRSLLAGIEGGLVNWCDEGKDHLGPFFTITVSAMEVGPGTGAKGYKRITARQIVSRLCSECLRTAVIRLDGGKLLSPEAQDVANG